MVICQEQVAYYVDLYQVNGTIVKSPPFTAIQHPFTQKQTPDTYRSASV